MKQNRKGFTLIELLVVIAIIGLLSTLAVVALNSAREKARDAKRVADIKQVQTALELYFNDQGGYPFGDATDGIIDLGTTGATTLSATNGWSDTTAGTVYMGLVPDAPTPPSANVYEYTSCDAGAPCTSGNCDGYTIAFTLEGGTGSLSSGGNCATPDGIAAGACPACSAL